MNLRNQIGQMLVMGFSGGDITDRSPVFQWIQNDNIGGVILFDYDCHLDTFGKNIFDKSQTYNLIKQLKSAAKTGPLSEEQLPLLTSIDYEGGAVDRLSHIDDMIGTIPALDQAKLSEDEFVEEIRNMASQVKELGLNLNFAPIVDLNLATDAGVIGRFKRSFSDNPQTVWHLCSLFVDIFNQHGIACSYKHFPGHGSASGDTHEGFVDVSETFQTRELEPYPILLKNNTKTVMVMTAHVVNKKLDPSGLPATMSYKILTQLLREQMGYDGVVISDDLQMHAISKYYSIEEALLFTINAGSDMLIFANQLGDHSAGELIDIIEQLVLADKIKKERINEAYTRIVRFKKQLQLLQN